MQSKLFKKLLAHALLLLHLGITSYLTLRFTKQTYGVNDDVIIQSWLSGSYTGEPEFMIRGSATPKMIFGLLVSNLYKITDLINWYSIIILIATLVSWYLIGLVILSFNQWILFIFYILVSTIHLLWFIPSPTYTASAILLTTSALVFLMFKINSKFTQISLISFLYVFAYLMRPESFYFATVVCLPPILYFIFKSKKKFAKKIIFFVLLTSSIILVDQLLESYYYNVNKDWANYKTLENLRYQIQANEPEKLLLENPLKFGWNINEAKLFENYLTVDKNTFNEDKYLQVLNNVPRNEVGTLLTFITESHKKLINSDINWEWFKIASIIPLSFFIFLFAFWPRVKIFLILISLSYSIGYLIMLYVATFLRQPERVQVSAIFLAILIPFIVSSALLSSNQKLQNVKLPNQLLMILILSIISSQVFLQAKYLDQKYSGANNVFWRNEIEFLSKFPNNSIFVGNASMFRNNWVSPYSPTNFEVEKRIFSLGWHNFSPHWVSRARNLGLNPDNLFGEIVSKDNIFWVSDPVTIEYVSSFLIENKFIKSKPLLVDKIEFVGDEYAVWSFNK